MIINGALSGSFLLKRGLRQGDPLSPYIFILCQNILSILLEEVENGNKIKGIKISMGSPLLCHLLFTDDSFIFFRTDVHSCINVRAKLKEFCMLLGQRINFKKFEIFLSPNFQERKKRWLSGILKVKCINQPSKYLGIELGSMNQKKNFFQPIFDKLN